MNPETLRIESGRRGCFHSESATINIAMKEHSATLSISQNMGGDQSVLADKTVISLSSARHLIDRFLEILGSRQQLAESRSTTVYEGNVVWTLGSTRNEWKTFSGEIPVEVMDDLLARDVDAQTKQKIRQIRDGYFNIAHELHRATMALIAEQKAESERCAGDSPDGIA